MQIIDHNLIEACKTILLLRKQKLLCGFRTFRALRVVNEEDSRHWLNSPEGLALRGLPSTILAAQAELLEIEQALRRMQNGEYGFCEETFLPIERERLLAQPWTRLSSEGSTIRAQRSPRLKNP